MKMTIGTYDVADMLINASEKAWTRSGALSMAEWLQDMEEDSRMEIEIDPIAIQCGYTEYKSVMDAASEYGWEADSTEFADQQESAARHFLEERTEIRLFAGGVLVLNF
jgi:hypothetical protein